MSENRNPCLRLLKNKGFKEESITKVCGYTFGNSTTLASNKHLRRRRPPVHGAAAMPGSFQNAECPSGVKALQRCTERLPPLPANRVALLALAGEGVLVSRQRRVAPAQEGAEGRNFWALRREARPIAVRGRPGDGEVVHFPAQGKIALPLVLAVRGHDIH